jgi:hypothetical protein
VPKDGEGFFVMYELEDHAVLASAPYAARPQRALALVDADDAAAPQHGSQPMPGAAKPWRGHCPARIDDPAFAARWQSGIAAARPGRTCGIVSTRPGLVGLHVLRHEDATARGHRRSRRFAATPIRVADWVLVACGYDSAALRTLAEAELGEAGLHAMGAAPGTERQPLRIGVFRHARRYPLTARVALPASRYQTLFANWRNHEIEPDQTDRDARAPRRRQCGAGPRTFRNGRSGSAPEQPRPPDQHGVKKFAELVAAKSGGKIKVQEYPSSQLGNELQQQSALQGGVQEMLVASTTSLAGIVKEFGLFDFPFLFSNAQQADAMVDGPLGKMLGAKAGGEGRGRAGFFDLGFRNVTNGKRPITKARTWKA